MTIHGQPVLIFASLHNVLGDGEGLMKAFDWRGASSLKPCLRHYNVLRKVFCLNQDRIVKRHNHYTFAARPLTLACGQAARHWRQSRERQRYGLRPGRLC